MKQARETIERVCFARWAMTKPDGPGLRYCITVTHNDAEQLDEVLDEMLHEMHTIANDRQCLLEAIVTDPATGRIWD